MKIILIDDDQDLVELYEDFFNETDLNIDYSSSFSESFDLISSNKYDVICSDLNLGNNTALELFELNPTCVKIIITGSFVQRGQFTGIDYIFTKPFEIEDLHTYLKGLDK